MPGLELIHIFHPVEHLRAIQVGNMKILKEK